MMENKRKNGGTENSRNQFKTEYKQNESSRIFRSDSSTQKNHSESGYSTKRPGSSYGTRRVSGRGGGRTVNSAAESETRGISLDSDKKRRIEMRRKKERIRLIRLRAIAVTVAVAIISIVLMFMTPLFNIQEIRLAGNNLVKKNDIETKVGHLIGTNLFHANKSKIESSMLELPLIKTVDVHKNMFPPYITITIAECPPAACMLSGEKLIVIDSELKVIDDAQNFSVDEIPSVSGVSVSAYELNKTIDTGSDEKNDILKSLLEALENVGLTDNITYISIDDITSIKFNYENRIEVLCGSQLELDRKIRMFSETINSKEMSPNAMGTIDLSVPGQAVYTP